MDDKKYNFGQEKYSGDYMSDVNQEVKTSQNLEAIERLFEEWDDDDKSFSDSFSLNNQAFDDGALTRRSESQSTPTPYSNSSFYEELLHDKKNVTSNGLYNEENNVSKIDDYDNLLNDRKQDNLYDNSLSDRKSDNLNDYSDDSNYSITSNDLMDQTREIDSVDLAELKAIQEELHRLYDEPNEENTLENDGVSQSKGKTLTKATKQGIAFSNGSLTKTFLDCAVLCFVTASMGFVFLMNIISHI